MVAPNARAKALIKIANPDFQKQLEKDLF